MRQRRDPALSKSKSPVSSSRKIPLTNGVYVKGEVQGLPVLFTADTGASMTVISTRVYDLINDSDQIIKIMLKL